MRLDGSPLARSGFATNEPLLRDRSVVSKLLNLCLRTAGAEICLLVLDKGGTLCAEAIARSESRDVQHLRRTDAIDVQPERCRFPLLAESYLPCPMC